MKKVLFFAVCAATIMLAACKNESKPAAEANAFDSELVADSAAMSETLEQQEVENMKLLINQVMGCLDSIQVQEKMIFKTDENADKEQVIAKLHAFKELLNRKQDQINKLTSGDKSNKATIANLQKMVEYLNEQLTEKSNRICQLEELAEKKDMKISELMYYLEDLRAQSEYLKDQNYEQDKQLNEVFYIVAEKKELKELGLLEGGGLSKKRANYANIDQSKFTKRDMRGFETLVIQSKSPKLITVKPESSYELVKNDDGTTTLKINDAETFWKASPYLIIQL